jgi:redox-sensitive bicupin YhaK (pirin superfamily)
MDNLTITTFRIDQLMHEDRGWTRGHAHLSFDDVPRGAPGWLDLGPVPIAVVQEIDPGAGYPMHHHENVQTLTMILDGALLHEDSLGNRGRTEAGELALLTAGTGIDHAEFTEPTRRGRAIMFWLRQREPGGTPTFEKRPLPTSPTDGFWALASGRAHRPDGALALRNDASLHFAVLRAGERASYPVEPGRRVYLVAPDAELDLDGAVVEAGGRTLAAGAGVLSFVARGATPAALIDLPCE